MTKTNTDAGREAVKPSRFTKKPVTIWAIQLNDSEDSVKAVESFLEGCPITTDSRQSQEKFTEYCDMLRKQGGRIIHTLEGDHLARFGDWIIKGVKGEFYPCKPDIFELTYDAALTAADPVDLRTMMAFEAGQRDERLRIATSIRCRLLESQGDAKWFEHAMRQYIDIETLAADPATPESTATWQGIDADEFVGEMRREGGGENEHTR